MLTGEPVSPAYRSDVWERLIRRIIVIIHGIIHNLSVSGIVTHFVTNCHVLATLPENSVSAAANLCSVVPRPQPRRILRRQNRRYHRRQGRSPQQPAAGLPVGERADS